MIENKRQPKNQLPRPSSAPYKKTNVPNLPRTRKIAWGVNPKQEPVKQTLQERPTQQILSTQQTPKQQPSQWATRVTHNNNNNIDQVTSNEQLVKLQSGSDEFNKTKVSNVSQQKQHKPETSDTIKPKHFNQVKSVNHSLSKIRNDNPIKKLEHVQNIQQETPLNKSVPIRQTSSTQQSTKNYEKRKENNSPITKNENVKNQQQQPPQIKTPSSPTKYHNLITSVQNNTLDKHNSKNNIKHTAKRKNISFNNINTSHNIISPDNVKIQISNNSKFQQPPSNKYMVIVHDQPRRSVYNAIVSGGKSQTRKHYFVFS